MNETQREIFNKIDEMLSEHFDAHLLIVLVKDDHHDEREVAYDGGKATALGLMEIAKHEILTAPPEDDEE